MASEQPRLAARVNHGTCLQAATSGKDYQTAVAIGSLQGKDMLLRITKRPGHEMEDVLDPLAERGPSLWGRLTSWASKPSPLSESALGTGQPFFTCFSKTVSYSGSLLHGHVPLCVSRAV